MLAKDQNERLKVKDNHELSIVEYMTSENGIFSDKVVFIMSQLIERPDVGVYVEHLPGYVVHNADDMDSLMALGQKKREQTIQDFPWRRFFLINLISLPHS